ncbi:MAG TPA: FKBP-type peptidyl-prolyl cis-trans isomerase [Solirubrobacterales bacterium]|nr:FKBP-type peptidyl-prolyl cis-trans isomerase [Solirubrobacterales bacterium]
MRRLSLIIGIGLALVSLGCGGSEGDGETTASEPFRIPVGDQPYRYQREVEAKWDGRGVMGSEPKPAIPDSPPPEFLALVDPIEGIGSLARAGSTVTIQYVGYLYDSEEKFYSSWDEGKPTTFKLGAGEEIEGWEEGIEEMEIGDRRELVVPPDLAYGSKRVGEIPPNSTLVYVIDMLDVNPK